MSRNTFGSTLGAWSRLIVLIAVATLAACGGGGTGAGNPSDVPAAAVLKAGPLSRSAGLAALAPDLVNTTTTGDQLVRAIGALFDGGYSVAWRSGPGLFMQRYDASGTKAGTQTQLPVDLAAHPDASIGVLGDGGVIAAYATETLAVLDPLQVIATSTIQLVRFDPQGATVSTPTVASFSESRVAARIIHRVSAPAVLALDGGGYLVAWSFVEDSLAGTVLRFRLQRYDQQDAPVGDVTEFAIGTPDERASYRLLAAPDGGYAIEVRKFIQGEQHVVFLLSTGVQVGSFFDAAQFLQPGTTLVLLGGGQFRLVPQGGSAVTLADGGYVLIDGQQNAQRFDSSGTPVGDPLQLDTSGQVPLMTPLADEGFAIAWQAPGAGGDLDVFARRMTQVDGPGNSRQLQVFACRDRASALSGAQHRTFMRDCLAR